MSRSIRRFLTAATGVAALMTTGIGLAVTPPPANGKFDYQLAQPYEPEDDVEIVVRDRLESPAPGKYNICYVNTFQTQPDKASWWKKNHPDLLVKKNGKYVIDPEWPDELLFDTSTSAKRKALMKVIGPWLDKCAQDGFDAIEPDNLDSWTRSKGVLKKSHNIQFAKLIAARAHAGNLAVAQKNAPQIASAGASQIGFDFAIAEECEVWSECDDYTDIYGDQVYEIEYSDNDRDADDNPVDPLQFYVSACEARGDDISVIYRDRDVVADEDEDYVYESC